MDKTMSPRRIAEDDMDMENTMPGKRHDPDSTGMDLTRPGRRDRKTDGRFEPGDLILNRYKVLSELGQGGMGVVYKCFDETAGVEIALKALPPELSHNTLEMEDIKENFQLVSKLIHQNIAISKTLEKDDSNGNYYLIMECVDGEDLRRWIKRKRKDGTLTQDAVLPVIRQVAEALDYAHSRKVIHRDIKPGNIMISADGFVKVLDFGLAAQIHTSMTRISMAYHGTSGTGPYMAPEQWRGRSQGASADQYALAVMTYEMLAGHLPFESTDAAVLREVVLNDTPEELENVPRSVKNAITRAMSKDPHARFESCAGFVAVMEPRKQSAGTGSKTVPLIIAGLILLLLVAGGVWFCFVAPARQEPIPVPGSEPVKPVPASIPEPEKSAQPESALEEPAQAQPEPAPEEPAQAQPEPAPERPKPVPVSAVPVPAPAEPTPVPGSEPVKPAPASIPEPEKSARPEPAPEEPVQAQPEPAPERPESVPVSAVPVPAPAEPTPVPALESVKPDPAPVKPVVEEQPENFDLLYGQVKRKVELYKNTTINKSQTFGEKLEKAEVAFFTAESCRDSKKYKDAQKYLEESLTLYRWIEQNLKRRDDIEKELRELESACREAKNRAAYKNNDALYFTGLTQLNDARKNFENGKFDIASDSIEKCRGSLKRYNAQCDQFDIQRILADFRSALGKENVDNAEAAADKLKNYPDTDETQKKCAEQLSRLYLTLANRSFVVKDYKTAYACYSKVNAEDMTADTMFNWGYCADKNNNIPDAIKFYENAGKLGYVDSKCRLAEMYKKNGQTGKACQYLLQMAKEKIPQAYYQLASIYLDGPDGYKNEKRGVKYLILAADAGVVAAQFYLGACYAQLPGAKYKSIPANNALAVKYLRMAEKNGHKQAAEVLSLVESMNDE